MRDQPASSRSHWSHCVEDVAKDQLGLEQPAHRRPGVDPLAGKDENHAGPAVVGAFAPDNPAPDSWRRKASSRPTASSRERPLDRQTVVVVPAADARGVGDVAEARPGPRIGQAAAVATGQARRRRPRLRAETAGGRPLPP